MAITFVGAASDEVTATGVDITLPTLAAGDIVIIGGAEDTSVSPTAPNTSGYTELFQPSVSTNAPACGLWYKVMGETPDSVVNVDDFGGGAASTAWLAMCFRGVDTDTPIDATTTNDNNTTGDPDAPSITTVTNNAAVVAWGFLDDDAISSASLSGYGDVNFETASAVTVASVMAAWAEIATAGAEDPAAFVTDGDDQWHAASVALRPAATGADHDLAAPTELTIAPALDTPALTQFHIIAAPTELTIAPTLDTPSLADIDIFASSTSNSDSITLPAGIEEGDLIVLFDRVEGFSLIEGSDPTGFTNVYNASDVSQHEQRISYKEADGTEGNTSVTGLGPATNDCFKVALVFRAGSGMITVDAVDGDGAGNVVSTLLNGDPAEQTLETGQGTVPLIGLWMYASTGTITTNTATPAGDGEISNSDRLIIDYKIYTGSPVDHALDMDDEGSRNTIAALWLEVTASGAVNYSLSVTEISTTPVLDTPALAGVNELAAPVEIGGDIPFLDEPTLTQLEALELDELIIAPALDSPAISQLHALAAPTELTIAPTLGDPDLDEENALVADDLLANAFFFDTPALTLAGSSRSYSLIIG